ncbi:MAG: hypothetical protein KDB00_22665 [Planctomycetales bacterium]|nr:hypothetical protein [Planctomycetales bacterium]
MSTKPFFATCGIIVVAILSQTTPCQVAAQTPQATSSDTDARLRQKHYRSKANALKLVASDDQSTRLEVTENPVMSWSGLGGWSGDVFVWSGKGRIQVVGCVGSQQVGDLLKVFQEFHSLADEPIKEFELAPSVTWTPPTSETRFREIPGAPNPAPTAARRLVQLRSLARQFSVGMQVTGDNVEPSLRLLPQPIAREAAGSSDVIDSALFTFVSSSGTDPEVFLLLEARRMNGELKWVYFPARFTTREVWMSLGGKEIWRVAPIDGGDPGTRIDVPYFYRNESTIPIGEIGG